MRTFAKIIGYGLVLLLVAAAIGFAYKFTNGFNEDFKTFYIEYGGRQILTTENKMTLKKGEKHRFGVKYTFDKDDAEPKDYKVKIVPNMTRDFDFTVNGEKYLFSKVGDLTAAFEIEKGETYFELNLPDTLTFGEVLKKAYNGKTVSLSSDAVKNNPYPFRLQISSYNEKVTYNIDFALGSTGTEQSGGDTNKPTPPTDQTEPTNPDTPDNPTEPTKEKHNITYRIIGNEAGLIQAEVICADSAVADETVKFSVSLIGDYKSEVTGITLYSGGKIWATIEAGENDGASNYYKEFTFTMPDGDVEIAVTIKEITVSEYHTLSYDTLGYGSNASVNVYMSEVAKAGEYMTVYVELGLDVQDSLMISSVVLQNADTGEDIGGELEGYDGNYDFTMPDCDVVVLIYLIPKEDENSGTDDTPTTPTTPTGETHSIIYSATYYGYDTTSDFFDFVTVDCPTAAAAGGKVTVKISLIESFAELYKIGEIVLGVPGIDCPQGDVTNKGNGVYEFTMPDCDVQLFISVTDNDYS